MENERFFAYCLFPLTCSMGIRKTLHSFANALISITKRKGVNGNVAIAPRKSRSPADGLSLPTLRALSRGLDARAVFFGFDHLDFLPPGFLPAAAAFGFALTPHQCAGGRAPLGKLGAQIRPRLHAVPDLRAPVLAARLDARRPMPQPDGGRSLVDFLSPRPRPAHKAFLHILGPHPQGNQPRAQGGIQNVGEIRHRAFYHGWHG